MNFFSRIFGTLRPAYIIRAYVIGCVFFALMTWVRLHTADDNGEADKMMFLVYWFACTLLFPFAKLVWDEIADMMRGGNIIILPLGLMVFLKWIVNGMLWCFAVFIAPLGIAYLWFRSRNDAAS